MRVLIVNGSPVRSGATAAIAALAAACAPEGAKVHQVCINDYALHFCRGCRRCHTTGRCVQHDGVDELLCEMDAADRLLFVVPSYWAEMPGELKCFVDRCTPYSNTHQPHAALKPGKTGYAIALRTGPGAPECERILGSMAHYFGHMEVAYGGGLALTSIAGREDVPARTEEIENFCREELYKENQ